MMSKVLKIGFCLAALAALCYVTPEAQAQRRGGRGGRGGGGSGVGVYVGPGGVGVDAGRGYYDGYRGTYYRDGYWRDGTWYGGRWYDRYPRYYETDYAVPDTETYEANYQDPSPPDNARVLVRVPDPNAEVFFNGSPTEQRGMERVFETPTLNSGTTYTYEIKARWRDASGKMTEQIRSVGVQRGRESMVDFLQTRQQERVPVTPRREKNTTQEQLTPPINQPPSR